jgi:hypothetical protein
VDEEEKRHYVELLRLLDPVDGWMARISSEENARPPERSPLWVDNDRSHPFETSDTVWHSLSHAVDHLNCLRTLLRDAQLIHMYAPFSLVRAALENASAAVWMLHPASRPLRITRRLRFAAADIRNGEQARELAGAVGPRTEAERLEQVRDLATAAGVDPDAAVAKVSYWAIVNEANDALAPRARAVQFGWKLCSAISHGDWWPTVMDAARTEVPGGPPGVARLHITANVQTLMYVTTFAVHMTTAGWQLLDERSRVPY